jgi:hypothetical protein
LKWKYSSAMEFIESERGNRKLNIKLQKNCGRQLSRGLLSCSQVWHIIHICQTYCLTDRKEISTALHIYNYLTIFIWFIISRRDLFVRYILYITILVLFIFLFTGKSNLMDAISFVLGEKTSNLRVKRLSVSNMVITKVNHCCCLQTRHFEN